MRPVTESERAVQVLMCDDAAADERATPGHRLNLQLAILKTDGVIAVHRALELQRQDTAQIAACIRHKSAAALRRRNLKAAIELGDVVSQEAIGFLDQ